MYKLLVKEATGDDISLLGHLPLTTSNSLLFALFLFFHSLRTAEKTLQMTDRPQEPVFGLGVPSSQGCSRCSNLLQTSTRCLSPTPPLSSPLPLLGLLQRFRLSKPLKCLILPSSLARLVLRSLCVYLLTQHTFFCTVRPGCNLSSTSLLHYLAR